jgi:uncharacterized membrane protein YgcG
MRLTATTYKPTTSQPILTQSAPLLICTRLKYAGARHLSCGLVVDVAYVDQSTLRLRQLWILYKYPCAQQLPTTSIELKQQINSGKEISPTATRIGACALDCSWEARKKKKMMTRHFLLCALLLVLLCLVASIAEGKGGSGGRGGGRAYIGGSGGARGSGSGSPRSLSGGTWAACIVSSLLVAAAML